MKNDQRRLRDRVAVFACIAIAAIAIDQLTKMWALSALADGRTIRVIPGLLSLTLVRNPGASLGMGSGMTWLISLLAMAACVALVVLAVRTISMKWTVLFAFAFAGAFGNLIDRVIYAEGFLNGKVVDFLNYGWSIGNVADIFLMLAGVAAVLLLFLGEPFSQKDLDEANGKTLGDDANATDDGAKAACAVSYPLPTRSSANDSTSRSPKCLAFPGPRRPTSSKADRRACSAGTFPNRRPCRQAKP